MGRIGMGGGGECGDSGGDPVRQVKVALSCSHSRHLSSLTDLGGFW